MEKHILQWTYWLGIASLAIAVLWRILNTLGAYLPLPAFMSGTRVIWYPGFMHWGLLLLVASIATSNYILSQSQKP